MRVFVNGHFFCDWSVRVGVFVHAILGVFVQSVCSCFCMSLGEKTRLGYWHWCGCAGGQQLMGVLDHPTVWSV